MKEIESVKVYWMCIYICTLRSGLNNTVLNCVLNYYTLQGRHNILLMMQYFIISHMLKCKFGTLDSALEPASCNINRFWSEKMVCYFNFEKELEKENCITSATNIIRLVLFDACDSTWKKFVIGKTVQTNDYF